MRVLVINCGSSSLKYQVLDTDAEAMVKKGAVTRLEKDGHVSALREVLDDVSDFGIEAVGHRVVHGGSRFSDSRLITDEVVEAIESCIPLAPLHNPANLAGIRAAREMMPGLPQVAVFDTAFHAGLPRRARTYAIDQELAERYGIRRYGFHGTSFKFVAREASRYLGQRLDRLRLVICHLGNGASVCAVEFGKSVETSMGVTPLEGLVMGTRSGDIDPGALLMLMRETGMSAEELDQLLNKRSGLLGVSGCSNDMRDVQDHAARGNDRARLAVAVTAHRVRKYIGAYVVTMGGADAVVMTGGIGENNREMRQRILQRLDCLGLVFDEDRNATAAVSRESRVAEVSIENAPMKALVVATDEELMIAAETARVVSGKAQVLSPKPIPVAVSARHVHLTEATFVKLFGSGVELRKLADVSQPGLFAAEQTVNLVGPRRQIYGVRVVGPFWERDQVEISRTDEFHLGVDAPLRVSGHVEGSAPVTLEGPCGRVHLEEGLICAKPLIHMAPADAEAYGVGDLDTVDVSVEGGAGELVCKDVVVRVSADAALAMHIDTDAANAAELPSQSEGLLTVLKGVSATLQRRKTGGRA